MEAGISLLGFIFLGNEYENNYSRPGAYSSGILISVVVTGDRFMVI